MNINQTLTVLIWKKDTGDDITFNKDIYFSNNGMHSNFIDLVSSKSES